MRVGYEFYVDASTESVSELAAEIAATVGAVPVCIDAHDNAPAYAFGVVSEGEVYPVVVRLNDMRDAADVRSQFGLVATLEGDLASDGERGFAVAQAIAGDCLAGWRVLVTYDTEQVIGSRPEASEEVITLRMPHFVRDQLVASKAFAVAAARAAQSGYEL